VVVDRRRVAIIAGMWIVALAIIAAIYVTMEQKQTEHVVETSRSPIYREGDRAPQRSRLGLAVARDEGLTNLSRGGARQTGRSPAHGPAHPRRAWRYHAGGAISGQPIVGADGTIFVATHRRAVHAVQPDGTRRWTANVLGPVWSSPAAVGDRVYVGSDADSLFALDRSGHVAWRIPTEGDADGSVSVAPDGTLRFTAGRDLFCVDRGGRVRWRFRAKGVFLLATPAIDSDGTAYVGSLDNYVYAIAADGRMRWKYRTGADVTSSPSIGDDGTIYVGSDDRCVHAIDRDGHRRWRTNVDGYVRAAVAIGRGGSVIAAAYGPTPRVVALDAGNGDFRWTFPIAIAQGAEVGIASSPLVDADGNIYFGAQDDFVYSLTNEGRMRWIQHLGADVDSSPTLTRDGVLLIGCDDGYLYAIVDGPAQ
jgi:outer membrane protein assembly factor BamB